MSRLSINEEEEEEEDSLRVSWSPFLALSVDVRGTDKEPKSVLKKEEEEGEGDLFPLGEEGALSVPRKSF